MSRAAVRNAADPKQVRRAEIEERFRAERDAQDLNAILSTPPGRRFLRRLLVDIAGINRSTYTNGPTGKGSDPTFLEGMRNVGLMVLAEINAVSFEKWLLALAEHYEELKRQQKADVEKPTDTEEHNNE